MGTWAVIDASKGAQLVDSKLVLGIKMSPKKISVKFKARLVARDFSSAKALTRARHFPQSPRTQP